MANRFIRLIEEGVISTEGELKSAFRALARATHPDLGAAGSHVAAGAAGAAAGKRARDGMRGDEETRGEAFIKARAEYEAAVRYLAPRTRPDDDSADGAQTAAASGNAGATGRGKSGRFDRDLFYADLEALLKAGFPKTARHDKERRKYARLRVRVRSALAAWDDDGGCRLACFDAFERRLAEMRDGDDSAVLDGSGLDALADEAIGLVEAIIDYAECGIVPLRASIEIEFAALREAVAADAAIADDLAGFLGALVADMDGGPALG